MTPVALLLHRDVLKKVPPNSLLLICVDIRRDRIIGRIIGSDGHERISVAWDRRWDGRGGPERAIVPLGIDVVFSGSGGKEYTTRADHYSFSNKASLTKSAFKQLASAVKRKQLPALFPSVRR